MNSLEKHLGASKEKMLKEVSLSGILENIRHEKAKFINGNTRVKHYMINFKKLRRT